ncbi:MAG: cyclopropane-fatty-acyl-phospholipid synthase family protein [Sneathiellaceae bacterium]
MSETGEISAGRRPPAVATTGFWMRLLLRFARHVECGSLHLTLPQGGALQIDGAAPGPQAQLDIRNGRFARRMLFGGTTGVGAAYIDGDFRSADLPALVEWAARNDGLGRAALRAAPPVRLLGRAWNGLRHNSRGGSRRNIAFHYDLGNDFYARWLDPTMTYSAACFADRHDSLESAQLRKYRLMARSADLRPDSHVLEIGTGWGGFACFAAREIGCRVTTITVSRAQAELAAARVHDEGLDERVEVALCDYRDVTGRFDRIVSIEMLEAVGERYWPLYFGRLRELMTPDGVAALQTIVIADSHFPAYRRGQDFIQRYIFPGGLLPSLGALAGEFRRAGLRLEETSLFGSDYARTLALWRQRFLAAWPAIERQGFDERFRRMWEFYLAYCEGGFRAGRIDVVRLRLTPA